MRTVLMFSKDSGGDDLIAIGVWLSPCHFGGGGSTPKNWYNAYGPVAKW